MRASAIALHGNLLAQISGGELRTYDAATLTRTEARELKPRHFCFARDGSLVAYSYPPGSPQGTVYRIGASRNLESFETPIPLRGDWNVVLPGRSASDVFVAQDERIFPLRFINGRVERGADLAHPRPRDHNREQLVSRDDGSLVVADGAAVRVLLSDGTGVSYAMKGRAPYHLTGASDDRIWYSHEPGRMGPTQLFLAKTSTPLAEEYRFDASPLRISHVASGGGAVAVIGFELRETVDVRWELIVLGEDGKERWRTPLPEACARGFRPKTGSLAIDQKHVVVSKYDSTLFGWDAATGTPIP